MRKSQTFASGAVAAVNHGNLEVRVPYEVNGAATRSAALTFARSVWGPRAALFGPHEGHTTGRDVDGKSVSLRRFDVVIVGSPADVAAAMARFDPVGSAYVYRAAREAFDLAGKAYADEIERHTAELVAKGYDVADRSLSEALQGNDGD